MKKILLLIAFLCLVVVSQSQTVRDQVEETYLSQLGVRELTGHNDGQEVETYLRSTGLDKGYAWCAAYVNYCLIQCDAETPKGAAWSPNWFPQNKVVYKRGNDPPIYLPQKGDVFGIYFTKKKRIAHVGFIHYWKPGSNYVTTVEGNTNEAGSREGDGVYKKRRLKRQVYEVANWIDT
ncbi:MAG: CHAP domain-containing protein [Methylococcales bacterium]